MIHRCELNPQPPKADYYIVSMVLGIGLGLGLGLMFGFGGLGYSQDDVSWPLYRTATASTLPTLNMDCIGSGIQVISTRFNP